MLEKMTQDEIGDEIGFIMGNCVYKQYYKDPKSKEPKKDVRNVNWYIDYFDEAKKNIECKMYSFLLKSTKTRAGQRRLVGSTHRQALQAIGVDRRMIFVFKQKFTIV